MHINKKNYLLQLRYLDKFLKKILLKSRINIFKIFLKNVKLAFLRSNIILIIKK